MHTLSKTGNWSYTTFNLENVHYDWFTEIVKRSPQHQFLISLSESTVFILKKVYVL